EARRLIVAGGSSLSTFVFPGKQARPVEETYIRPMTYRDKDGKTRNTWIGRSKTDDVTAIAPVEGTADIIISHVSGLLQKCRIEDSPTGRPQIRSICRYSHPGQTIQALDAARSGILACATSYSGGSVSIYQTSSPWAEPYSWRLQTRPWSIMLQPTAMKPQWLAVGHSGPEPLSLYTLGESGLPVSTNGNITLRGNDCSTAVYGLTSPPLTSPIGNTRDTLLSGWYDGSVRVHDLRRQSKEPVIELVDPLADSPVYSIACGGGSGCTIAAGTARHGVIRVWDIRKATTSRKTGHSIFGPGKDSSPVYGLQMEHDRLFGVTDRRAYMLEFGRGEHQKNIQGHVQAKEHHHNNSNGGRNPRGMHARQDERNDGTLYYYRHSEMKLRHTA
ncbi:MAG: hypothetical protein CYPHOPRED_005132, partial [Cyphobasidiales sp. Tagirdzhanova-0007]